MRQMCLHTEAFEDRCLYRSVCAETLWHIHAFTHRSFHTQIVFQRITEVFTQRSFYAQELLHTDAFIYTQKLVRLYRRRLLHTEAFTQRSLCTRTLFHTENPFPQSSCLHYFTRFKMSIFTKVFDVRPTCRAKGSHLALENRSFWRCTIKSVAPDLVQSQFLTLDNHFA